MAKADDKVEYENEEGKMAKEKYSHFELLEKRVDILQDTLEECVAILRANNLTRTEKIEAPYFDEDRLFRELEEEGGDSADSSQS